MKYFCIVKIHLKCLSTNCKNLASNRNFIKYIHHYYNALAHFTYHSIFSCHTTLYTTVCTTLHTTLCTTMYGPLCVYSIWTTVCTTLYTTVCTTLHTTVCTTLYTTVYHSTYHSMYSGVGTTGTPGAGAPLCTC